MIRLLVVRATGAVIEHEDVIEGGTRALLRFFWRSEEVETWPRSPITWPFTDGDWKKQVSLLPDPPENGFTLPAGEDAEQVALLCQTYESGDEASRRMTKLLAGLSVAARH